MPRIDLMQTNFSGGELSPRLYGRPDVQKYNDSVKRGRDVVFLQQGGVRGRPGTDFVAEVKDSADATRLIPFVYSASDAYLLEHGDGYVRVWRDGSLVHEFTSPFTSAQVFDLDFAQGADTMFLALQAAYPHRLQRWTETRWVIEPCPFDPQPYAEVGHTAAIAITLGATSGSTTATAGSSLWLAADVGRTITYRGGVAEITGYSSATVVNVTITSAFSGTALPASGWVLTGSPRTTCNPAGQDPVGKIITLTLGAAGWRSTDVGKHVSIHGGLVEITAFTSDTVVDGRIKTVLGTNVAAEADGWTLEGPVWGGLRGYPRTVTLHEQRAVFASSPEQPQTIWGSRAGLYFDFTRGVEDDDSFSFDLQSDEINPIFYLSSERALIATTHGGAWTLTGGVEKPITPTNVRASRQARAGSDIVRPESVDDDLFYAQRAAKRLRSLYFAADLGAYDDDEASTLSEHLMTAGIAGMTWQQTPERMLWVWKDDGSYCGVTVSRRQNVRAFAQCAPAGGGIVESMCTIPGDGEDVTYLLVRRTVNGTTKRYIERMTWTAYQDCRVSITNSPASATVSGLSHLEGLTVSAVADGVDLGDFTVSAGAITLPRAATTIDVGLRFVPEVQLLQPEFGTGMGVAAGKNQMTGETRVLFSETTGCSVNGQPILARSFGSGVLDSPPPATTGWERVSGIGQSPDSGEITLTQPQSYPWCILAAVRRITANPG